MPLEQALQALRSDPTLARSADGRSGFVEWRELPAKGARYGQLPTSMDPRIIDALAHRGVQRLYTHQSDSLEAVLRGENVVVVTPTASGKTLCYNLPVVQAILQEP